ncbi:MAG: hypothetical protein Q8S41_07120 [Lutibacter sp.]|nr:hypothetical protein [Lutibacter sp.]
MGVEPAGCHYSKKRNVKGKILLLRYDVFKKSMEVAVRSRSKPHITTNLNTEKLEASYDNQARSRLREMFNLVSFDSSSTDKRK